MGATASSIRAGRAFVELFADDTKLQAVLNRTRIGLQNMGGWMRTIGVRMAALGPALGVPILASLDRYAKFELQMKKVAAVTRLTGPAFRALSTEARRLGRETVFTSAEAASAMFVLSKQGYRTAQDITAIVGPALDLAAAAEMDLAEAVRITTGILKSQRFPVDQPQKLTHAIDMLTEAFHSSNMSDITELGDAMKYVGPVTEQLKVPLDQVIASIQALSDANIRGEMAGTTLRGSLLSLIAPSEKAAMVLRRLRIIGPGFNKMIDQATGGLRPLHDIIGEFETSFGKLGLSAVGQQSILAQIFDDRQASGFARLVAVGSTGLGRMATHLQGAAGRAAQLRDVKFTALKGHFEILTGAIDELAIAVGEHLAPEVMKFLKWGIQAVETLSKWAAVNGQFVMVLAESAAAITATGLALIGLGTAANVAAFGIGGIGRGLRLALSPAQLLADSLTGVLRLMASGERLGRRWAGFLGQAVIGGGKRRRSTPAQRAARRTVRGVRASGRAMLTGAAGFMSGARLPFAAPALTANVGGAIRGVGPRIAAAIANARELLTARRSPFLTVQNAALAYQRFEAAIGLRAGSLVSSVRGLTERESSGAAFGTRTGGMLGRIRGVFSRGNRQVGLTERGPGAANWGTAHHELGHAVDTSLGGGTYASRDRVGLPGRLRSSLERLLPRRRMRRMTGSYRNYFSDPSEQFARFFQGMSAPMQQAIASRQSNRGLRDHVRSLARSVKIRGLRGVVHAGRGFDRVEAGILGAGRWLQRGATRGRRVATVGIGRAIQLPARLFQQSYRGAMAGMAGSRVMARSLSIAIAAMPTRFLAHGMKALDVSLKLAAGGWAAFATAARLGRAALTVGWSAAFGVLRVGLRGAIVGVGALISNTPKLWRMVTGFTAISLAAAKAGASLLKLAVMKGWSGLIGTLTTLLSPQGLLIGGMALAGFAVVANWNRITTAIGTASGALPGTLARIWQSIRTDAGPTFIGIKNSAVTAFNGISEALQAGDIPAAMEILWVALRGIWDQGIGYLSIKWLDLTTAATDAWISIQETANKLWPSIANAADLMLFDWFGTRLNDVTAFFAQSWDWIKSSTASLMDWSKSAWGSMFSDVGNSAASFTDFVWNSFEWVRKKLAQILLMAGKVASIASKVGTFGFGGFDFNMGDAMQALDNQFAQRGKQRMQLKADLAGGQDAAAKERQVAAELRLKELEAERIENQKKAAVERAKREQAQKETIWNAEKELNLAVQNTKEARDKREEAEKAAAAKREAEREQGAAQRVEQRLGMPQGLNPGQQRAWQVREKAKQRLAAQDALKAKKQQAVGKATSKSLEDESNRAYLGQYHAGKLTEEEYGFFTGKKAPKRIEKAKTAEEKQKEALGTWGIDWEKKKRDTKHANLFADNQDESDASRLQAERHTQKRTQEREKLKREEDTLDRLPANRENKDSFDKLMRDVFSREKPNDRHQAEADIKVPDMAAIAMKLSQQVPNLRGLAGATQQNSRHPDNEQSAATGPEVVNAIHETNRQLITLIGVTKNMPRFTT